MKYYYEKPKEWINIGKIYICDHSKYNRCTLFLKDNKGIAVIQERYNKKTKVRWWSSIDPWLSNDLYFNANFNTFFNKYAKEADENKLYPTFTIRQIMWALRMKPLKKEYWEY